MDEASLKSLSLRGNKITDAGCRLIASVLKNNRTLIHLNLFDNKIKKGGAESLADALKMNTILTCLSLGRNDIGDEGAFFLAKALCNSPLTADEVQNRKKLLLESKHEENVFFSNKRKLGQNHGKDNP